jgi:hypothetical protein
MTVRGGTTAVVRGLPIDAALVGDVLVQLRRDAMGCPVTWTLGTHGSADLDAEFFPAPTDAGDTSEHPAWTTTARLWDPDGLAVVHAVVEITAVAPDACELTVRPELPLTPWWAARAEVLEALTQAVTDELGEELLWHASRAGV